MDDLDILFLYTASRSSISVGFPSSSTSIEMGESCEFCFDSCLLKGGFSSEVPLPGKSFKFPYAEEASSRSVPVWELAEFILSWLPSKDVEKLEGTCKFIHPTLDSCSLSLIAYCTGCNMYFDLCDELPPPQPFYCCNDPAYIIFPSSNCFPRQIRAELRRDVMAVIALDAVVKHFCVLCGKFGHFYNACSTDSYRCDLLDATISLPFFFRQVVDPGFRRPLNPVDDFDIHVNYNLRRVETPFAPIRVPPPRLPVPRVLNLDLLEGLDWE